MAAAHSHHRGPERLNTNRETSAHKGTLKSEDVFKTNEKLSELTSQRANFSQTCELQPDRKWAKGQAADRNRNLGDADTELEECRWTHGDPPSVHQPGGV